MLSFEIQIFQAMLVIPGEDLKNKKFFVEVETDEKIFRTEEKSGSNPIWNHKNRITSRNGILTFTLFVKSGFLG